MDKKKWHYLAVKNLSTLFCIITSKNDKDFYCLNIVVYISFRLDKKLKEHENVCNNYDYCYIEMPKMFKI